MSDQSSRSGEWYTPPEYARSIRKVLGPIDFDPFSCPDANARIQARSFASKESLTGWPTSFATVYCNPPGGPGNRTTPKKAWASLMVFRELGLLRHAIFMGFNLSILRTAQTAGSRPKDGGRRRSPHLSPANRQFSLCFPEERICFINESGQVGEDPTRDNVVIYVPGVIDRTNHFLLEFQKWGDVR